MSPQLFAVLIERIIIPEIAGVIRAFHAGSGGKLPTDAEVIAALQVDAGRYVAIGEAWLAAHPEEP